MAGSLKPGKMDLTNKLPRNQVNKAEEMAKNLWQTSTDNYQPDCRKCPQPGHYRRMYL